MTKKTYSVPTRFFRDHVSRCDFGCPYPEGAKGSRVSVDLTAEQVEDLMSDADHYQTDWVYMGREYFGLGRSAAATVKALKGQGVGGVK